MTNEQSIQNFKYGDMQFDLNKYSKDLNKNEVDSKFNSVFEMLDNNEDGWIVKDELQENMGYMANKKGLLIFGNGKDNIVLQFLNKYFPELVSKITDRQEIEQNEKELANEFKNMYYENIAYQIADGKFNNLEPQGNFTLVYDDEGRYLGKYDFKEIYVADNSVNDSGFIFDKNNPEEIKCYYKRKKQEGKPDIETRYYENKGFATVTQGNETIEYDLERNDNSDFILGKIRSKYTTEYDNEGNITKQTIKNIADGTTTVLDGNTCGTKYDSEGNVLYTILTAKDNDEKVQIHLYPDGHIEGATEMKDLSGFRCQYNGNEYKVEINDNKIISITKNGKSIYSPLVNGISKKLGNTSADEFIKYIDQYKDNITKTLDIYQKQKGESLFETVISDFTMPKEDRIKILKHIINLVLNDAKEQGIATEDLLQKFEKEISYQMNKFGFANADYLEVFTDQTKRRIRAPQEKRIIVAKDFTMEIGEAMSKPNGKIDERFSQGTTGDCWFLASIKAIANSPKGLKILNDSLKVLPNGDVQVTLKGINKTYIVTKQELENNIQMANGDGDVRALEIAVNKHIEEERGVLGQLDIEGNAMFVAYNMLIGKANFHNICFDYVEFTDEEIDSFNTKNKIITVAGYLDEKHIQVNSTENDFSSTLIPDHAYAVLRSDKDYVYLINPWNSENELKVPRKTFKEYFNYINEIQL